MVTTSDLTGTCVNKTVIAIVDLAWYWLEPNHKSWVLVGLSRNLAKFVENLITWRWCGNIEDRERLSSGDEWRASVDTVWNVQRWSWDVVEIVSAACAADDDIHDSQLVTRERTLASRDEYDWTSLTAMRPYVKLLWPFLQSYFWLLSLVSGGEALRPNQGSASGPRLELLFIMAALRSRCGHYIFVLFLLCSSSFFCFFLA